MHLDACFIVACYASYKGHEPTAAAFVDKHVHELCAYASAFYARRQVYGCLKRVAVGFALFSAVSIAIAADGAIFVLIHIIRIFC